MAGGRFVTTVEDTRRRDRADGDEPARAVAVRAAGPVARGGWAGRLVRPCCFRVAGPAGRGATRRGLSFGAEGCW